ncbi:sulfatase-like hydrolase/transferase [Methyloceanibacter sp. wino2]|uniref:sulfatase-like hydrolase/transferase n=1 Tax=Methyloceanibacter sp. wino2 TaxID=2170729 RepID=UPI00131EF3DB|nr:sulfatase-like hydrolase/transferase [Methyloceanibacter sp. wino2]
MAAVAALALLAAAALWWRGGTQPHQLNIIFLTVESWRAETAEPGRMPNLFRAAAEGSRYVSHRAISAWTAPNIIGILTGLSPIEQGVHARGQSIDAERDVFLEDLSANGWQVAGLQSFMAIDVFRSLGLTVEPKTDPFAWLAARSHASKPFVLWHHYLNTHLPYAPSKEYRGPYSELAEELDSPARARLDVVQTSSTIPTGTVAFEDGDIPAVRALYLGGVAEFDAWFGKFWEFFNRSGLRDTTILVVTADHGEELFERGNVGHASTTRAGHLHEEILRVPLFIWRPGQRGGAVVEEATDHTDIVPMLRSQLGLPPRQKAPDDGYYFAATSLSGYTEANPSEPSGFEAALIQGSWKLRLRQLRDGPAVPHLYDLDADPDERSDLAEAEPDRVAAMSQTLLPKLLSLWRRARTDQSPSTSVDVARPEWTTPSASRTVRYADIADGARLQWTGDPSGQYVVEYRAGDGPFALDGVLDVSGTTKDFGTVGEFYWRTWVAPYRQIKLRVMPEGREHLASKWIELTFEP